MKRRILFIDDEQNVLDSLKRLLWSQRDEWDLTFISSSLAAWNELQVTPYDVVVSDVRMPDLTGIQLLERMQRTDSTRDILVIMLTGETDRSLKRKALDLGATDLLNKPVGGEDLLARLRSALRLKSFQDELKAHNEQLEQTVQKRTRELVASRIDVIWRLGKAAEYRDEETGNHVVRVGCFSRTVARELGLNGEFVDNLFLGAPLHDLGKIGIPDRILLKPGKLNETEWQIMRRHSTIGAEILRDEGKVKRVAAMFGGLQQDAASLNIENPILETASSICLTHHEKWDGSGYPSGLAGESIPLESRIVAIADVYDALRSQRPYKRPFSLEESLAILAQNVGKHFDPEVHAAFVSSIDTILAIEEELNDGQESHLLAEALP
ncbi:MAG: HD domain-containing phosphohydrolase [Aeoliella sp.]